MLRDMSTTHATAVVSMDACAAAQALLQDCAAYFSTTGRRVTFEYTLMSGTNDDPEQVRRHCEKDALVHVSENKQIKMN